MSPPWSSRSSSSSSWLSTTTAATTRLHVLGCGSIGVLFASLLVRNAGPSVRTTMLLRPHHRRRLRHVSKKNENVGVVRCAVRESSSSSSSSDGGRDFSIDVPAEIIVENDDSETPLPPIRNLLLCTKAYDARAAVRSVADRLAPRSRVLILCNGALAVRDELASDFASMSASIAAAATTHGARRLDDDDVDLVVVRAGDGDAVVGDAFWADLLRRAGLGGTYDPNVDASLWRKLVVNCAINPLTALADVRNGALLDDPGRAEVVRRVARETAAVARAVGAAPSLAEEEAFALVRDVARATRDNASSMLQDVRARRPTTEIDHLNGHVGAVGRRCGTPTPENDRLRAEVTRLVESYQREDETRRGR